MMNSPIRGFLDIDSFKYLGTINDNKYTALNLYAKKNSPSPKYVFKTFRMTSTSSKIQKMIMETFYQISTIKSQYLQRYKYFSLCTAEFSYSPTFSMKYISTKTLKQCLEVPNFKNTWTKIHALNCLFAVAEAINFLHEHLLCHGNICPSNIVIDAAEQCYVCDFGLSNIKRFYIKEADIANNEYRAPEMQGGKPSEKGDTYSYGVLMCQISLIFFSRSADETLHDFLMKKDKRKFDFLPSCLSRLIQRCLSIDPEDRPTFHEIRDQFQNKEFLIGSVQVSECYKKFLNTLYIENLAKQDDPFALNKLGEMYDEGKGVEQNSSKAKELYFKAAKLENSEAQSNYGVLLQDEGNLIEGARYLKMSTDQGNLRGMANYAVSLKRGEGVEIDPELGNYYMKLAADEGYSYAQVNYGFDLLEFNPTPEQIKEGFKYIRMAMDQGDPNGFYTYANILSDGNVIAKNLKLALDNYKIAADLGYGDAMFEYAKGNFDGIVIPKNKEIALKYFIMADENGVKEARPYIDLLNEQNNESKQEQEHENEKKTKTKSKTKSKKTKTNYESESATETTTNNSVKIKEEENSASTIHLKLPESAIIPDFNQNTNPDKLLGIFKQLKNEYKQIQEIEKKAKTYNKDYFGYRIFTYEDKFVKTGNACIIYKYGKLYDNLPENEQNISKAMNYYRISANLGNIKAETEYGIALQSGEKIAKNSNLAVQYLANAAHYGNLKAKNYYGLALFYGEGVTQDKERGLKLLQSAADSKYPVAQLNFGIRVDDHVLGHKYIEMAAKAKYEKAIFYYARDLMKGIGVEKDLTKAADIYRNLYEKENSIEALINLLKCLLNINRKEYIQYLKVLADQADQEDRNCTKYIYKARFRYGVLLCIGNELPKDEATGIKYIMKSNLADKVRGRYPEIFALLPHDFSSVQENVNSFLRRNNGVINKEEDKIIKRAYKGNLQDTFQAAQMIEKAGDFQTANFFYEIAADSNQPDALFVLGKHYLEGKNGLEIDEQRGNYMINQASSLGYVKAKYELVLLQIRKMNRNTINSQSFNAILNELSQIAAENYIPAFILKAKFLAKNGYHDDSKKELKNALLRAPNDSHILYKVGKILLSMSENVDFALQLIEMSSNEYPKACYFLAKYYYLNKYKSPQYIQKAVDFSSKACEYNIKDSQKLNYECNNELRRMQNDPSFLQFQFQQQLQQQQQPKQQQQQNETDSDEVFSINTILKLQGKFVPDVQNNEQSQKEDSDVEVMPNMNDFIDLSLPNDKLIEKGEEFQSQQIDDDAFQCFEEVARRGDAYGYYKCAQVCSNIDKKLDYYQNAVFNKVKGAFSEWRTTIYDQVKNARSKNTVINYAKKFEDMKDFADASILYQRAKETANSDRCFQIALQNIQSIDDGMQQFDFGVFLEQRKEIDHAFEMFKKAAENGITKANTKIKELSRIKMNQMKKLLSPNDSLLEQGICYLEGKNGLPVDYEKAFNILTKASNNGSSKADYYLGKLFLKQGNSIMAIYQFKKSADLEDPDGLNSYGDCLRLGLGIEKNEKEAILYYKKAAQKENLAAEYNYGRELFLNASSQNEKNEGIYYLKKAAEQMHPDAMYMYSIAIKDSKPEDSQNYYDRSIEKGSELAIKQYGKELEEDELFEKAAKFYKSEAEKGSLIGCRKYAKLIINGEALEGDDIDLAQDLLKKAANIGEAKDQYKYASFLNQFSLEDQPPNKRDTVYYFKKAAELGYAKAFFVYAQCLENGDGITKDKNEAKKYYTLSYKKDPQSPTRFIITRLINQDLIDIN